MAGPIARPTLNVNVPRANAWRNSLGRHQVGLDCLERRKRECGTEAEAERQRQQTRGSHDLEKCHHRQQPRAGEHPQLAADQQPSSVEDVGERTAG